MKHINLWNKPASVGDLVEVGHHDLTDQPYIGTITEVREPDYSCVLANGELFWCNPYDLKPLKKKPEDSENI